MRERGHVRYASSTIANITANFPANRVAPLERLKPIYVGS